jgi:hypothetical protein
MLQQEVASVHELKRMQQERKRLRIVDRLSGSKSQQSQHGESDESSGTRHGATRLRRIDGIDDMRLLMKGFHIPPAQDQPMAVWG